MEPKRESGIELLKLIAMFGIILSHIFPETTASLYAPWIGEKCLIDIYVPNTDFFGFLMRFQNYFGGGWKHNFLCVFDMVPER